MSQGPPAPGVGFVSVPLDASVVAALPPGAAVFVTSTGTLEAAEGVSGGAALVLGLLGETAQPGNRGLVMFLGYLSLPESTWNGIVTGGAPTGLTPGARYYVSPTNPGQITSTAPTSGAQRVYQVGVALSANTMIVRPTGPGKQN